MPELLSPGVAFTEPRVTPAEIASASTSIASFIGIAERGPINDPVLIGSFEEYVQIYGGFYLGSPLPGAVKAFFDNGGKSTYINRVGHYTTITNPATLDAVQSQLQLSGDGPANTALMKASSHGSHGDALSLTTRRIDTLIATTGAIAAAPITEQVLSDIRRIYVGAQVRIEDSVTPANKIRFVVLRIDTGQKKVYFASATATGAIAIGNVMLEEWDLTILRDGSFHEKISRLTQSTLAGELYFKDRVNNGDPKRQVVVFTDNALAATPSVDPRPVDITSSPLTGGSNGTTPNDADHVGDPASKTGLNAFDSIDDVNIMSIPGRCTSTVHQAIIAYCERRQLLFGVLAVNQGQTPQQAKTYVQVTANLFSEYAAIYYPWVKISDPVTGLLVNHTPEGHAIGVYSRTDATRGVQKAPAGTPDGRLVNVLGPERPLTESDRDLLYPANINPIVAFPGKGTLLFGSRTLSSSEFRQINVRRVFNFVKLSLRNGTLFLVFEPNDSNTRAKVRKTVGSFLLRLWRRGVLKGEKATEAFFIICDETNNPPSVEQAGYLICRVGLAISRPAEFVIFELVQDTRALDAELAAAGV